MNLNKKCYFTYFRCNINTICELQCSSRSPHRPARRRRGSLQPRQMSPTAGFICSPVTMEVARDAEQWTSGRQPCADGDRRSGPRFHFETLPMTSESKRQPSFEHCPPYVSWLDELDALRCDTSRLGAVRHWTRSSVLDLQYFGYQNLLALVWTHCSLWLFRVEPVAISSYTRSPPESAVLERSACRIWRSGRPNWSTIIPVSYHDLVQDLPIHRWAVLVVNSMLAVKMIGCVDLSTFRAHCNLCKRPAIACLSRLFQSHLPVGPTAVTETSPFGSTYPSKRNTLQQPLNETSYNPCKD